MTKLARRVRYRSPDGMNLQYGLLADRVGRALGIKDPQIGVLMELLPPSYVTNKHWVLVMDRNFAAALRRVGWIS